MPPGRGVLTTEFKINLLSPAIGERILARGKVLKAGWERHPAAQKFFAMNEAGDLPMAGPFLVIAGEADQSVPLDGVKRAVAKACAHGNALAFRSYPGLDHDPTMEQSTPDQLAWVRDRIAGKPFANECPAAAN